MKMLQFGCGSNHFPDWKNYDREVDITKHLPFETDSVDLVYCSHTAEHLSGPDCFRFFEEVARILKPNGVFRVVVPSIGGLMGRADRDYLDFLKNNGYGDGANQSAIKNLVCNHGHLIFFSPDTLRAMLFGAGFENIDDCIYNESSTPELCNKEWHGKVIGIHNDKIESIIIEAQK